MKRKEAKRQLQEALDTQQTISIKRLKRLLEGTQWERIDKQHHALLRKMDKEARKVKRND